jgi:hypothetical protein
VTVPNAGPHTGRSVWAVAAAFLVVIPLTLGTDHIFHMTGVYPPYGVRMSEFGPLLLALSYRIVYGAFGAWLTARLAPWKPMKHVWIQAAIGQVLALAGVMPALFKPETFGPLWYPLALALTVFPTAWFGGRLYVGGHAEA